MPKPTRTISDIIDAAVLDAVAKIVPVVKRRVAALVAEETNRSRTAREAGRPRGPSRRRRARHQEITRWIADRRARRVPNFVIELTGGLDTKKKIVAKFGPGVVFEKGKPLPKAKAA